MSTEEKAKAYDEALKRIKGYRIDEYGCTRLKPVDIFPELAESEDERINEEIRNFLIDMECKREWIAYLEKQKEQKRAEWSEEDETHRAFILESLEEQIRFCKKDAEGAYNAKQIRTAQNWLKSLRPQPHWKPIESKAQELKALARPLNDWLQNNGNPHQQIIITFDGVEWVEGKAAAPYDIKD